MYSLGYSAAVGYLMALAATDLVKGIVSSSGLLGKVSPIGLIQMGFRDMHG